MKLQRKNNADSCQGLSIHQSCGYINQIDASYCPTTRTTSPISSDLSRNNWLYVRARALTRKSVCGPQPISVIRYAQKIYELINVVVVQGGSSAEKGLWIYC